MDAVSKNKFFCIRCERIYHQTLKGETIYASDCKPIQNIHETRICNFCTQKIGAKNLEEMLIVCMYCKKCYGIFFDGKKKYFSPVQIEDYPGLKSHGICHDCYKKINPEEFGEENN